MNTTIRALLISLLLIFSLNAQSTTWYVNFDRPTIDEQIYNGTTRATAWNFMDDTDGYSDRWSGVNWNLLKAGDSILVSGTYHPNSDYGFLIHTETIAGGQVIIAEDWHPSYGNALFENADTLVTIPPYNYPWSNTTCNVAIWNTTGIKFVGLTFRVSTPRPSYHTNRSVNIQIMEDSLITFEDCHITTNGIAGNIGMQGSAKIEFIDCLIENDFNYFTEDNDIFTWSQTGFGAHKIKGNTIINRNAYEGENGSAAGLTIGSNSVTISGKNWITNFHQGAAIIIGGKVMPIYSNTATTLNGVDGWYESDGITPTTPPLPDSYTIMTLAHRDVMQMGYGYNPSRPTTEFINNFIYVPYEQNTNTWNQGHYLGANNNPALNSVDSSIQNFVYINNIFVFPIDTNGAGIAIVAQNWDWSGCRSKWEFYNNTFITTAGWFQSQAADSIFAYNNAFVTLNSNSVIRLARSDKNNSVDSIDYNFWSVPNWTGRIWSDNHPFLWDDYEYLHWQGDDANPNDPTWQSVGNDVHSQRDVNGTMDLQNVQDSVITAYYTTEMRDGGKDLSYLAVRFPEIMYDILGNPRNYNGGWDVGALEYVGEVVVDSLPDAFTLADISNAELNTEYYAQTGDLVHFDSAYARINVGEYNVNGQLPWKSANERTMVFENDDVYLRYTTGSTYDSTATIILTVGQRTDTWTVTTKSAPIIPDTSAVTLLKDANYNLVISANGKLRYMRTSGYTSPADPILDTIPPTPPTLFSATNTGSQTEFQTSWTNPGASDLASIQYYEGSANDTTTMSLITTLGAINSYLRTGRTANTTYWGAVKAVDDSGNVSYFSNTDNVTTSASESGTPLANLDLVYLTQSTGQHLYDHSSVGSAGDTTMQEVMTAYNTANGTDGTITRPYPRGVDYPQQGDMIWHWNQVFFGGDLYTGEDLPQNVITEYAIPSTYSIINVNFGYNSGDVTGLGLDTVNYGTVAHWEGNYKYYIRNMVKAMSLHPDKYWVLWTIPPVDQASSGGVDDALRHANFNDWMVNTLQAGLDVTYGAFPENVYIFDVYALLKDPSSNWMNPAYSDGGNDGDPHANAVGQDLVAPIYVNEVFNRARAYRIP